MIFIIKAPNVAYNRKLYGVQFENGIGRTENRQAASWFSGRAGFTVGPENSTKTEEEQLEVEDPAKGSEADKDQAAAEESDTDKKPKTAEEPEAPEKSEVPEGPDTAEDPDASAGPSPFDKMTLAELKIFAKENNIDISGIAALSNIRAKIKTESGK